MQHKFWEGMYFLSLGMGYPFQYFAVAQQRIIQRDEGGETETHNRRHQDW